MATDENANKQAPDGAAKAQSPSNPPTMNRPGASTDGPPQSGTPPEPNPAPDESSPAPGPAAAPATGPGDAANAAAKTGPGSIPKPPGPTSLPRPSSQHGPGLPDRPSDKRHLTIAEEIEALTDPSFMTSLARGLAVVRSFSDQRRSLTIAQISHRTGIPRAAVRRCLYTLKQLGYADSESNNFFLKPKILTLGYSYLSSTPLAISAQPYLNSISRQLNESCSLAVIDDHEVLYVARSATSRIMSVALNTGSRLPAYCTSLGRAILSNYSELELEKYFAATSLRAYTDKTVVSPTRLREILKEVKAQGYAMVEEELEVGLHSIAVPVRGASGAVHAALNIGAQSTRVSAAQMVKDFLPVLQKVANDLSVLLP